MKTLQLIAIALIAFGCWAIHKLLILKPKNMEFITDFIIEHSELIMVIIYSLVVLIAIIVLGIMLTEKRGSKLTKRRKAQIEALKEGTKILIGTVKYDTEAKFICLIGDDIHVRAYRGGVEEKETLVINSDRYISKA